MPIYPSSNYDTLMSKSQLTVNNVAVHQEIVYQTNASDGTGILSYPTDTIKNLYDSSTNTGIMIDLYMEVLNFYASGLAAFNGNEDNTGPNPNWFSAPVDLFTNLKQIKLRRLQTQCKLLCFEMKRLTAECSKILLSGTDTLPEAPDNRYPSSKRSYNDPNAGW